MDCSRRIFSQGNARQIDESNNAKYAFYSNYITEIPRPDNQKAKKKAQNSATAQKGYEKRRVMNTKYRYAIPRINVSDKMSIFETFFLAFGRGVILERLDEALNIEIRENTRRKWTRVRKIR